MQTHRAFVLLVLVPLVLSTACGESPSSPMPDGAAPVVPIDPAGTYRLRSTFSLSSPPEAAAHVLAELASATDGPDDPSRFMIDRLVARLPEGRAQLVAAAVAPYLAAYVQQRIDTFAPQLAPNLRALAEGVNRIARRFGTTETLTIDAMGTLESTTAYSAHHTFTGLRFDAADHTSNAASEVIVDVAFAPIGLPDIATETTVLLAGDRLTITEHAAALPYSALLKLGVDRAVVPRLVPGALDLAAALDALVDCDRLGEHVAEYLGFGAPELYAGACSIAVVRLASELYERLETAPASLTIAGFARAVDADSNGPMDAIADGAWTGALSGSSLAPSNFEGSAP